jgi:hypothetical protein
MKGNKFGISGKSILEYKNLKVTIFKNKENKPMKERKFLSFLANTFVVKDANPAGKKPIRVGVINYRRLPEKPFFYTLWKSLLEGLKGSVV